MSRVDTAPALVRVFGVVAAADLSPGASGEDPVTGARAVTAGELAALVEDVPATEWSADALTARLEDLRWLETQARRHDDVLRAHLPRPVVPCPLTTVFTGEEQVQQMLRAERDQLSAELSRVRGHVELGVVVHVDAGRGNRTPQPAAATSGAAYLAQRLADRQQADAARADTVAVADRVHDRLSALAADSVLGRPRPPSLDDDAGLNVLNGSYLVSLDRVDRFDAAVDTLQGELDGARVRRTGPWAPFHFVGAGGTR